MISWKAVIVGNVFDIVVSGLLGLLLLAGMLATTHGEYAVHPDRMLKLLTDPRVTLAALFLGGAVSIVAGYVAAAIAGRAEVLNGALSSLLCMAEGVYTLATQNVAYAILPTIVAILASPLLGMAGGYLRQMRGIAAETVGGD